MDECWGKLPLSVLLRIFGFLDLKDRRNASLVSKAWSNAFNNPSIWSSLSLEFCDRDTVEFTTLCCRGDCAYAVVSHCYQYLEHLTVTWDWFEFGPEQERFTVMITDFFNSIIENGKVPQLKTLFLTTFTFPIENQLKTSLAVDSLIISVTRFVRTQTHLEEFWIMWDLSTFHEVLLVDAVRSNSAHSLATLELNEGKNSPPFNSYPNVLRTSLRQFSNLAVLVLAYENFGEDVLCSITDNCKELNLLVVEVAGAFLNFVHGKPHLISSLQWKEATQKLPQLKVNFSMSIPSIGVLDYWPWDLDLLEKLLPRTVPLVGFTSPKSKFQTDCVDYLRNFADSLRVVELYCKTEVTKAVVDLIAHCSHLRALKLVGPLPLEIIEFLESFKFFTIDLQVAYLLFDELQGDKVNQLKVIRRNLIDKQLQWSLKIVTIDETEQFSEALEDRIIRFISFRK